MNYKITKEKLFLDLLVSFYKAKKHKSKKNYIKYFEHDLDKNLEELCDELLTKNYKQEPSTCFVIDYPKKREIFAANFRDRIVHHLYFDYTHELFERNFIYDTYSCIKGKGTHFGIKRLAHHIKSESENYTKDCYILKMDLKGYFMNINRLKLYEIAMNLLKKYEKRKYDETCLFCEKFDFDLIYYLTKEIILLDPTTNCKILSTEEDYIGLPDSKRMSKSRINCGLPIGNLTSQLFSNVFLSVFDNYVKRELKCKHYGRYVDDFYIVSKNKDMIIKLINQIKYFLKSELFLELSEDKTLIVNAKNGIEFLGAFIKPYRMYASNKTLKRMRLRMKHKDAKNKKDSIISMIGILSHYKAYNIIKNIFYE